MVVSPYYQTGKKEDKHFEGAFDTCSNTSVGCFDGLHEVGFMHQVFDGVDFVFVKHKCYEREGGLYGDDVGTYGDNQFRFTLLSHAACEAPLKIDFGEGASANGYTGTYGDDVVFVANDWHAGLVPLLVRPSIVRSGCTRTLAPSPRFTTSCTRAWSRTRRSVTWAPREWVQLLGVPVPGARARTSLTSDWW